MAKVSNRRSLFFCGMLLLLSTGCMFSQAGSGSLAYVVIEDVPVEDVRAATLQVFHDEFYNLVEETSDVIVFERTGNMADRARWAHYGESGLQMRVVVACEPYSPDKVLVKADAYILRQKGSRFVKEKIVYSGRRPYQNLLRKIKVKASR